MNCNLLKEKPFYLDDSQVRWVEDTLDGLSLEEKAGQLFVALGNAESEEGLRELIVGYGIGGVLFRPAPAAVVKEKYAAAEKAAKVPLLMAANLEEGGAGVISDGTYFGSELLVAAAGGDSSDFAKACAKEGLAVGVNWTFSPVVDIDFNFMNPITNVRTFGSDPEKVLANARSYVNTIQKCRIAAACKHFPGDGSDFRDQHLHPSYNRLSAPEWYATYGRIYKELIDDGLMSIMVGHIGQPAVIKDINPEASEFERFLPGSQSNELLTGVLREKFGFNGLIITDATIMGGYTMTMPRREAIPLSIAAGCDMLCFGTDIREDISWILEAVHEGRLFEDRLDDALTRVLALKAKVALSAANKSKPEDVEAIELRDFDTKAAASSCADKAITLVKDIQGLVPVSAEKYPNIRLITLGDDDTYDGSMTEIAASFLEGNGFNVERYRPLDDDLHGTRNLPEDRLTLIICNMPAASNQTMVRIKWCEKHALEIPRFVSEEATAFISFANPYHLQDVPRVRTYINAYCATKATIEAALGKLLGISEFKGVSPVDAFCGLDDTHM